MDIILEIGSTVTKIYKCYGEEIEAFGTLTIEFKRNYKRENKLDKEDVDKLISKVKELKTITKNVRVYGTSIFRDLNLSDRKIFIDDFLERTGIDFNIVSQEDENELTVHGAVKNVKGKVAVFIGGGGSTEIAIYDKKIVQMANTPIGAIDVMQEFQDLGEDIATTELEKIKEYIKERLNIPKQKADVLILAGGGHKVFALNSGISYEKNNLYEDPLQPIKMSLESRRKDTEKYFYETSLDKIRKKSDDPKWWYATRAMCAFVLVVAEEIGAKYIVPTDIPMIYGLVNHGVVKSKEENV